MPYPPLPEVDHASLLSKTPFVSSDIDVSNDYGTPNLLFFYYAPPVGVDQENDFQAAQQDARSWIAWEVYQAEKQLQIQLQKKTLPTDDSIQSRLLRTMYRSKIVSYLRENSEDAWLLSQASPGGGPVKQDVKNADVNSFIRKTLRDYYITDGKQSQLAVVLSIISDIVGESPEMQHRYYLSGIFYTFDPDAKHFELQIQACSFNITQTPKEKSQDTVRVSVEMLNNAFKLNRSLWAGFREKAKDEIDAGEKVRKEMSLDFFYN